MAPHGSKRLSAGDKEMRQQFSLDALLGDIFSYYMLLQCWFCLTAIRMPQVLWFLELKETEGVFQHCIDLSSVNFFSAAVCSYSGVTSFPTVWVCFSLWSSRNRCSCMPESYLLRFNTSSVLCFQGHFPWYHVLHYQLDRSAVTSVAPTWWTWCTLPDPSHPFTTVRSQGPGYEVWRFGFVTVPWCSWIFYSKTIFFWVQNSIVTLRWFTARGPP